MHYINLNCYYHPLKNSIFQFDEEITSLFKGSLKKSKLAVVFSPRHLTNIYQLLANTRVGYLSILWLFCTPSLSWQRRGQIFRKGAGWQLGIPKRRVLSKPVSLSSACHANIWTWWSPTEANRFLLTGEHSHIEGRQ